MKVHCEACGRELQHLSRPVVENGQSFVVAACVHMPCRDYTNVYKVNVGTGERFHDPQKMDPAQR